MATDDDHRTVLVVVEDEDDMRMLIRLTLAKDTRLQILGEATSAEAAIEQARSLDPGLIILDQYIDGPVTGLEVAPDLKQVAPRAKILLFTAFDMAAEARREPAVDEFLRKDDFERLLPTVQRLLDLPPIPAPVP